MNLFFTETDSNADFIKSLALLVVRDLFPFRLVDSDDDRCHIRLLNPNVDIPSRKRLLKYIDCLFTKTQDKLIERFRTIKMFAITTDTWTHSLNSRSYISVTGHYLNKELRSFKQESVVLGVREFREYHTSENLAAKIESILDERSIPKGKVVAVVSDGAPNICSAIKHSFGRNRSLWCFAHQLNLIVQDSIRALKELNFILTDVKEIVTFFKHSNNASSLLRTQLEMNSMDANLKLKQECVTRWNSKYIMIERFLKMQIPVSTVLLQLENCPSMVSKAKLKVLAEILLLLKPFYDLTLELSGQNYVTISSVIPLITCPSALKAKNIESELVKSFKAYLELNIEKRFQKIEEVNICAFATLLDPRFKKVDFSSILLCSSAVQKLKKHIDDCISRPETQVDLAYSSQSLDSDIWQQHDENVAYFASKYARKSSDLIDFLSTKVSERHINPLDFWWKNQTNYPEICDVALSYLIVPAASVPSERIFSKAGDLISEKRNRFLPENVNKLLVLGSIDKNFLILILLIIDKLCCFN